MILTQKQLHGLDYRNAELLGKPHIGAYYEREDVRSHRLIEGASCVLCHRQAQDAHHVVPRHKSIGWTLNTPYGMFVVLSPLFSLCRDCHEDIHVGARYEIEWVWKEEQFMRDWWEGYTLSHGLRDENKLWQLPINGEELFKQGYYLLIDKKNGEQRKLAC